MLFSGRTITRIHLERFLAPLHCLRRLELVISVGAERKLLDAGRWENFIVKHLPRLSTFNFRFCIDNIDPNILDQYRSPFWLDEHRRWFVACDAIYSCLFTVPYFAPTSIVHSLAPVPSDLTTLPIEQHVIFYDRVKELRFDSGRWTLPYRYNHIEKLFLDGPCIHENVVNLSKVQTLIVNNSEWSLYMIAAFIKESMPSVNYLSLNCTYHGVHYQYFPNISLEQIRTLSMPQYGKYPANDLFHWSRLFPCVERLIISIYKKRQIPFLIDRFKNMLSGFFYIDPCQMNVARKRIQMTDQWLLKNTFRLERQNTNLICQVDNRYYFSVYIWIGENYKTNQQVQPARDGHWWHKCSLWNSAK